MWGHFADHQQIMSNINPSDDKLDTWPKFFLDTSLITHLHIYPLAHNGKALNVEPSKILFLTYMLT